MQAYANPRSTPVKIAVALLLTIVAGYVDAVGFLLFWNVFTAHMTGNTVHFGISLVARHWTDAWKAGLPIPTFLLGSLAGRCILEFGARRRWRRVASLIFLVEAALLSEVIWMSSAPGRPGFLWSSILLLVFCMGLQTAALTRVGPLTVHTTFVTGMLNSLGQRLADIAFWLADAVAGKQKLHTIGSTRPVREAGLLTSVWIAYAAGAVLGALLTVRAKGAALFVPLGVLFVAICVDQVVPLSIEEEQEQAKQAIPLEEKQY